MADTLVTEKELQQAKEELQELFSEVGAMETTGKAARDKPRTVKLTDKQIEFCVIAARMTGISISQFASRAISNEIMRLYPNMAAVPQKEKDAFYQEYERGDHG